LLKINDVGRVGCRIIDPEGNQLIQLIDTGGYAGLVAALNANATVAASVFIQLVGTIANAQAFSSAIDDYTFFSGGQ
tara:strand:- start:2418 stop:2648 length:231 start_codon:yes stop_codon:yes gene_type:complete